MIEKLVPLGLILICIGGFGCIIEFILFGTYCLIFIGWIGLVVSMIPLLIVVHYLDNKLETSGLIK